MRPTYLPLVVAVSLLLHGCTSEKSCTLISCVDQFTLNATLSSGRMPTNLAVDLVVDGVAVTCPALEDRTRVSCSATTASIALRQGQTCVESKNGSAVSLTCTPDGKYSLSVEINGSPKSVAYAVKSGGVAVKEDTLLPVFTSYRPNGAGCDPICRQANVDITIEE